MTREETIERLKYIHACLDMTYANEHERKSLIAVDLAIKALEQDQKEIYDKGYADGWRASAEHIELCGDCISRQAVLDAFADYVGSGMSMNDFDALWDIVAKIQPVNLQELKTEWIPVTERLPEKNDIYVVWTSKGFGDHLSTSYYNKDDGWTIEVCAWKENGEPYKGSESGNEQKTHRQNKEKQY